MVYFLGMSCYQSYNTITNIMKVTRKELYSWPVKRYKQFAKPLNIREVQILTATTATINQSDVFILHH